MRRRAFRSLRTFEALEDRRMMAGDISFDNHTLTITGAGYNDVVQVQLEDDRVYIDLFAGEFGGGTDHHDEDRRISDVSRIVFNGLDGNDTLNVVVDHLDSGVTLDNIVLEFHGGANDDTLNNDVQGGVKTIAYGDAGRDILYGSRFDDVLEGGAGADELHGGVGNDRYVFSGLALGFDNVLDEVANADSDTLDFSNYGVGVNVNLATNVDLSGNVPFAVYSQNLMLKLSGGTAIENVKGTAFHDVIAGNSRDNYLFGGGDADDIEGAGGNDITEGGAGNDSYYFRGGNLGSDTIIEAANTDTDTLNFAEFVRGATIDLTKYGPSFAVELADLRLSISGSSAIENVYGSNYDDTITGNSRDNLIFGLDGADTLRGGAGVDRLHGGNGDDKLFTDALDLVFGEAGRDWFDRFDEGSILNRYNPHADRYLDWGFLSDVYQLTTVPRMPKPDEPVERAPVLPHPSRPETPETLR